MMFAGTSPVLWPTASLIYFLVYLSDKYLLLNFHPRSNSSNEELHMYGFEKYYNATIVLYCVCSVWSFQVFNQEVMPLFGLGNKKNDTMWDKTPGAAHLAILVAVLVTRNTFQCCLCCAEIRDQLHELLGNTSEIAHVASNSYLREIPLKHIRGYFIRLLDQLKFAKASYAQTRDKETNEYIMLLGRRVEDVKELVDEFGFVLGSLMEYETLKSLMTKE